MNGARGGTENGRIRRIPSNLRFPVFAWATRLGFVMKWTAVDQRGSTGEGTSNQFVWEWDGYNNNGGYMWDPAGP